MECVEALKNLLSFNGSISEIRSGLKNCDWDGNENFPLERRDILAVIEKFLQKRITTEELVEWANLIECRENFRYEDKHEDIIKEFFYQTANPEVEGNLTTEMIRDWKEKLSKPQ